MMRPAPNRSPSPSPLGARQRALAFAALLAALAVLGPAPARAEIWGYADLHAHTFSSEGFGGLWFQGKPAAIFPGPEGSWLLDGRAGIDHALPWCSGAHGWHHSLDLVGKFGLDQGAVPNASSPQFDGWPRWSSINHQTMYYEWLKRAHDSGMRLMVMLAVNNEMLCRGSISPRPYDCNDMNSVNRQFDAARDFEAAIDQSMGGEGQGWFRIVETPQEARQAIANGQLAVVLGIEVDNLFDCTKRDGCTKEDITDELTRYYDLGARHLFPIHVFDNAFGGAAVYNATFNDGNYVVTGDTYKTLPPDQCRDRDVTYRLDEDESVCEGMGAGCRAAYAGLAACANPLVWFPPILAACALSISAVAVCNESLGGMCNPLPGDPEGESCNVLGLAPLGEFAVREMMAKHMIIDIDHMSSLATDRVLTIAEEESYPLVAGHTGFTAISHGQKRSEGQKSPAVMARLRDLGALVAPILSQGTTYVVGADGPYGDISPWGDAGKPYPPCSRSGWGWAQAYKYAVDAMDGPVALGSDFNGVVPMPVPRYATSSEDPNYKAWDGKVCYFKDRDATSQSQAGAQGDSRRLQYPFTLPGIVDASGNPKEFERSNICAHNETDCRRGVDGKGELDFNVEGLAHVGLLPDFLADLKANGQPGGFTDADFEPLFRSAEAYIQLWERVDAYVPDDLETECTGTLVDGRCLYESEPGASCRETCSAEGLYYDPETATLGSDGAPEACLEAWQALGGSGIQDVHEPVCGAGIGCHADVSGTAVHGTCLEPPTTGAASGPDVVRVCACTATPPPTDCDGDVLGSDCLYMSELGGSCADACAAAGRVYDPATARLGSDGTDDDCQAAWEAAGLLASVAWDDAPACGDGLGCHLAFDPISFGRCSETTTESAASPDVIRLCVCDDAAAECGNGVAEQLEQCDGADLGGATCPEGMAGEMSCTQDCTLDGSQCTLALSSCPAQAEFAADETCTAGAAGDPPAGCTVAPPGPYGLGVTEVTAACTDSTGSTDSCTTSVVVTDQSPPAITCPAAQTVECDGGGRATVALSASASDNCTASPQISCTPASGSSFPKGSTPVACSARDDAGNRESCQTSVTVADTQQPTLTCSGGATVTTSSQGGTCTASTVLNATASDVCDGDLDAAIAGCPAALSLGGPGSISGSCSVSDASGNGAACEQTLTLVDDSPPDLFCPLQVTLFRTPAGSCTASVLFGVAGRDSCDGDLLATTTPASGSQFPLGSTTVNAVGTDQAGNQGTCSFPVVVNEILADTGVTVTPGTRQYSDRVTFTATASPASCAAGGAPATEVTFYVGTQVMGTASLVDTGGQLEGSLEVSLLEPTPFGTAPTGQLAPGSRTVRAVFGGVGAGFDVPDATTTLTIEPEDARATYTGAVYASTSSVRSSTAQVTLSATVEDVTAVTGDLAHDADPGDIRNATVTFEIVETGQLVSAPLGLVNAGDTLVATATTDVTLDIGNADSESYTVRVRVGGYYVESNEVTVVTVSKPLDGFITGGGYLLLEQPAGLAAGDVGSRNNFGFNVKYNKKRTNLQGRINAIVRRTEADGLVHVYQIKGNSMTSLVTKETASGGTATFNGKANIQDITDPLAPISVDGNGMLQVVMTDRGEPGRDDSIAITLWDKKGGLWFSSRWERNKTVEQTLAGGNLVVH